MTLINVASLIALSMTVLGLFICSILLLIFPQVTVRFGRVISLHPRHMFQPIELAELTCILCDYHTAGAPSFVMRFVSRTGRSLMSSGADVDQRLLHRLQKSLPGFSVEQLHTFTQDDFEGSVEIWRAP